MAFAAFQIVRASALNRIQPVVYTATQSGNVSNLQTITTIETDSLNCSVTFSTATAAVCTAYVTCDMEVTVTGASTFQGRLNVDGSTITSKEAHIGGGSSTRDTVSQTVDFTLSGPGSHTVKLRLLKSSAAATMQADDTHTGFSLQVREVV